MKVRKMIEKFITSDLAVQFSWAGKRVPFAPSMPVKEPFQDLSHIVNLLYSLCQLNQIDKIESDCFKKALREYFRRAPTRKQRENKQNAQTSLNNV
jgi:hypothetical protein